MSDKPPIVPSILSRQAADEILASLGIDPDRVAAMPVVSDAELEAAAPVAEMFLMILGDTQTLARDLGGVVGGAVGLFAERAQTELAPAIAQVDAENAAGFCFELSRRWADRFDMGLEDFLNSGAEVVESDPGPVPPDEPVPTESYTPLVLDSETVTSGVIEADAEPLSLQELEGHIPCRICGCTTDHPCKTAAGRPCHRVPDPEQLGAICSECEHLAAA